VCDAFGDHRKDIRASIFIAFPTPEEARAVIAEFIER